MSSSIAFGAALCASGVPQSSDHSAFSMPKGTQTLSSSLRLLANEDPSCLFIVRRINKLGFKASRLLRQHFSVHGHVVRVLVAHSTVRQQDEQNTSQAVRRRPSSLGFVQMQSAEAVRKVLAGGLEQEIKGSMIRVQKFEHKAAAPSSEEDSAELVDERCAQWQRMLSADSVATCATTASTSSAGSAAAL